MHVLCINLERSAERRAAMEEQFCGLGISYEIFRATDWKELTETDLQLVDTETRRREGRHPLTKGMIACAVSHRRVCQHVIDQGFDMVVVIEDDVTLAEDTPHAFEVIKKWKRDADIIFLHRGETNRKYVPVSLLGEGYRLGLVQFTDWGAQGYVITREGARQFLRRCPRICYQIDHTLHSHWLHELRIFYLDPPIVHIDKKVGRPSAIGESRSPRRRREFVSLTRRLQSTILEEFRRYLAFRRRVRTRIGSR